MEVVVKIYEHTLKSASFCMAAITHEMIQYHTNCFGRQKQFMHNNENGIVGFDTPALHLPCFDALKKSYRLCPKRPQKGRM